MRIKPCFNNLSKGDEEAFEKLYKLYFPRLYSFSVKNIKDGELAKDVVCKMFLSAFGETHETFRIEQPEAFLYKMVRNASINYIRHIKAVDNLKTKIKGQYLGEELYYIDMVGDEPYILIEEELRQKITNVLESLPDKCRAVFRMSRIEGLKNMEIARKNWGSALKAVEKHISKALEYIAKNSPIICHFKFYC